MATYKYYIKTATGEQQEVSFNANDSSTIGGQTVEEIKQDLSTLDEPIEIMGVDENGNTTRIECDSIEEAIAQLNKADNVVLSTVDTTLNTQYHKQSAFNAWVNNKHNPLEELVEKLKEFVQYADPETGNTIIKIITDLTSSHITVDDALVAIKDYNTENIWPELDSINGTLETKTDENKVKSEIELHLTDFKTANLDPINIKLDTKVTQTEIDNSIAGSFKTFEEGKFKTLKDLVDTKKDEEYIVGAIGDAIGNYDTNTNQPYITGAIGDAINNFKNNDFKGLSDLVDTKVNGDDVDTKISEFDTSKIKPITEILDSKLDTDGVNLLINGFENDKIKPITDELANKLGETDVNNLINSGLTNFDNTKISEIRDDLNLKISRTDTESLIATAVGDKVTSTQLSTALADKIGKTTFDDFKESNTSEISRIETIATSRVDLESMNTAISNATSDKITSTQLSDALKDKLNSTQVGSAIDDKLDSFKNNEVTPIMTIIGSSTDGIDKDTLFGKIAKNNDFLGSFIANDFTSLSDTVDGKLDSNTFDNFKSNGEFKTLSNNVSNLSTTVGNKLDTSAFNTFKTTGEFKILSDKVDLKAASSDLSSLSSTVSALSSTVDKKANISDIYTSTKMDELLGTKADSSTVGTLSTNLTNLTENTYTKTEVDNTVSTINTNIGKKADSSTTYTKTDVDNKVSTINSNISTINTTLGNKANISDVYSRTDADSLLAAKASTTELSTVSGKLTNILDSDDDTKVKYSSMPTNIQDIINELNVGNSDALDDYVQEGIYLIKYRTGESLKTSKTNYAVLVVERDSRFLPMVGSSTDYTVTQTLYGEVIKKRSGTITMTNVGDISGIGTGSGGNNYTYTTLEGVYWTTIDLKNTCMHKIELYSASSPNYKAYITVYNKDNTAFTPDTFKTWLISKGCTSASKLYSCTGIASTVGSVIGIYTNGTNFYLVHTSTNASGSTYEVSQPFVFNDNSYTLN